MMAELINNIGEAIMDKEKRTKIFGGKKCPSATS
jgi:hypothetical protein